MFKKIALTICALVAALILGASSYLALTVPGGLSGFWLMVSTIAGLNASEIEANESTLTTADGFQLELIATDLGYVRFIIVTDNNDLIVSRPDTGQIQLLQDKDGDGTLETHLQLLGGLEQPQGLILDGGWLYFSENGSVSKVAFDSATGTLIGEVKPILRGLPYGIIHTAKAIGISPDRKLHVNVGSPCNVCEPADPQYAAMLRSELDGTNLEIFATGLRNSVGFDWTPWSGELYATVNARDLLGDNYPPDELNLVVEGGFYGWPYYHSDNIPDPEFGNSRPELAAIAIPPVYKFRPHNAPLGIHFVAEHSSLPEAFKRTALVALHGSWNRSTLDGYKVVSLHWDEQGQIQSRDFVTGFLADDGIVGRPVGIAQDQEGRFYITDDLAGRIYRVQYRGQ